MDHLPPHQRHIQIITTLSSLQVLPKSDIILSPLRIFSFSTVKVHRSTKKSHNNFNNSPLVENHRLHAGSIRGTLVCMLCSTNNHFSLLDSSSSILTMMSIIIEKVISSLLFIFLYYYFFYYYYDRVENGGVLSSQWFGSPWVAFAHASPPSLADETQKKHLLSHRTRLLYSK